jgi:potassium/chloride transporter 4/5/6
LSKRGTGGEGRAFAALARLRARLRARPGARLGTFLGVYTPTILTILGVILYLRFGWVVGHAGLARTLGIVVLANGITLVTTLSLSAVATNTRVGVGGAYYIISRSLGLEIGGAIGLPLFLSQAFSVTLYAFGLAESLRFVWPEVPVQPAALAIVVVVAALAYRGADGALRSQIPILGLIGISLAALAAGAVGRASWSNLSGSLPSGELGFWAVFAVFFPAVTGIMAGLGLSGDLADPKRAIPRGALAANLTGLAVYLLVPVLLAFAVPSASLRGDPLVWSGIAVLGAWTVLPALWGAIFSSAVGSMLGAPRTLQALAMDHLAPRRLAGARRDRPLLGLAVSLAIALGAVALGDLNAVAVVVSMFFLTVYGTLNLVAALEELSREPSWRPALRVPWALSLGGALACFGVMLLINAAATAVALVFELALWLWLQRRERKADWGDVRRGVYEALIRWALVRLARRPMTARSWRPHILVFTETIENRLELVRFGDWFSQDRGVVTVCELLVADLVELERDPLERQAEVQEVLGREGILAFAELNVVPNVDEGIVAVAQANGMAGIESNTVLLGWPEDRERLRALLGVMRRLERLHKSLLVGRLRPPKANDSGQPRSVHVWWGGLQRNSDLMLLLAYLLTRNPEWRDARIRVLSVASNELMKAETERTLAQLIPEIRIRADVEVVLRGAGESVKEVIHAESAEADLVLLGLATPPEGEEEAYAQRLIDLAEGLPALFFVKNSSLFIGDLVTGEEERLPGRMPLAEP